MSLNRRTLIAVAFSVLFVVGLAAFANVSSRPSTCASCHTMKPAVQGLSKAAHAQVDCYSCHAPSAIDRIGFKVREVVRMYPAGFSGKKLSGVAPVVASTGCLDCHSEVMDAPIAANGLKIQHSACSQGSTCASCHSAALHADGARWSRQPVMDDCVRCHIQNKATTACDACHEGRRERDLLTRGPWQVTHGTQWQKTHGAGDTSLCVTCHEQEKCVKCHGLPMPHDEAFGTSHGRYARSIGIAKCTTCHSDRNFCNDCHGIEMPHPATFLKQHSSIAPSMQEKSCLKCHAQSSCDNCHAAHIHPGGANLPSPRKGGGQ